MGDAGLARRLRRLPRGTALGREVRIAEGFTARLLGLAHLNRDEAGAGLLIPRCSSIHTFGMRFPLDIYFLDEGGSALVAVRNVPPRRFVARPGSAATLEVPIHLDNSFGTS